MAKRKKDKPTPLSEMTAEQLKELDRDTLVAMMMRLLEQNQQLSDILRQFVQDKHGPKTEHFENPNQLRIFGSEPAQEPSPTARENSPPEGQSSSSSSKKKKPGHTKNPMPAHLERRPIAGKQPSMHDLTCACCGVPRQKTKEIVRKSRLEHVPATVVIEDFIAVIYECTRCGDLLIVEPPAPTIEDGDAGPALKTEVAVAKFEDHMPLNRQEQRFARMGVHIARSTMVGWLKSVADRLRPLYDRMHKLLLLSKVVATDDTPVKVLDRSQKKKLARKLQIKTGRIWIYRGDDEHPFNVFQYTEGRGRAGPLIFLSGFRGYLQGDCFSGNLALCAETGAIFVACLVHARRYFIKAQVNNKTACDEILQMFFDLFEIERTARELELPPEQIKLMREEESKPILDKMKKWLDDHALTALPKSSFGKGVNYCLNNWTELNNFLLDGDIRAENNLAEQEMKRIAMSRKNWLFLGSDTGGKTAEVLISLISTCRRHGVNPNEYLKDVYQTLGDNPNAELDPLLPQNWKRKRESTELAGCQITPQMASA